MDPIRDALATVRLGAPQVHRNLALFPLLAHAHQHRGYLLLDEALERSLARVTERSAAGRVPELAFENAGAQKILLVDGDELAGASEQRIVSLCILVGAGSTLVIPPCADSEPMSHARGAISSHAELEAYAFALRAEPRQRGAVIAIDGRPVGLELFDGSPAFARCFGKLLRRYAARALPSANGKSLCPSEDEVRRFVDALLSAEAEEFPALGEGRDIRIKGEQVRGAALADDGRMVHFAGYGILG